MRVITDFVMNHTSSDHPWFQESRLGAGQPEGATGTSGRTPSTATRTRGSSSSTREQSNWTFDPVRERVLLAPLLPPPARPQLREPGRRATRCSTALRFWLDLGLDGFRLDAVPYLFEEEGTNCENLPATHAFLKRVRAEIDAHYTDRVLLAEANQWPEDVVDYFGDGDECHMAFHFPVMPRMFMALRREEARPMVEILDRTPPIPDNCQWGLFLRNHDELTLEMVTDEERDYMYAEYAKDPRMKLNLGIRRRLAPLLDGGRDEIELMHAILFSLPGSPGALLRRRDRDGRQRLPRRPRRRADADAVDGRPERRLLPRRLRAAVPAAARWTRCSASRRSTSRRSSARRRRSCAGCSGSSRSARSTPCSGSARTRRSQTSNPRVFAHVRQHENDTVLCVHNLARSAQAVELDLSRFEGRTPVEMMGRTPFPPIGELPYFLTFGPRGFFWFLLQEDGADA